MNKMITTALLIALGLGLSQTGFAKEHKGPQSNQVRSHSVEKPSHVNRVEQRHRRNDRYEHRREDRWRNDYRPRPKYPHYRVYHDRRYPRYRTYPTTVYYLGQDWYYYGGYYHPYPRGHIHTHHCHHRYWEPIAVGIILGSVLGW